uniref:WD repeat-containing protein 76 n=1 Tax=Sipha flava TaxID=143950 RepID=A0A2S2R3H0_9HEMI
MPKNKNWNSTNPRNEIKIMKLDMDELKINKSENVSSPKLTENDMLSDEEDENLTYAQLRDKRMKENMSLLEILGVNEAADTLADNLKNTVPVKKGKKLLKKKYNLRTKGIMIPTRRSLRLANIPLSDLIDSTTKPNCLTQELDSNDVDDNNVVNQISILTPNEDSTFFKKLSADLVVKEAVNDFHTCDIDRFTKVVKSLDMNNDSIKVSAGRIYSLAIHPSETSLIIVVGDIKGNITLFNKIDNDSRSYQVHGAPVNCISFCTWDPHKLFSTSHDGSVRCGDINKQTFDIIYNNDLQTRLHGYHTTWHTEYERNLLIGSGSGHVDLIDTRKPNIIMNTSWCHSRSVRTVQCHPLEKNYFLTSSGVGEVSLWDIRNMTDKAINPVLQYDHSKSLTSAFFSATGIKMVSTSNDDKVRIFNTSKLNSEYTKPFVNINHNNHTGRWLSVMKAKWNPNRDDSFFIGSMLTPKQVYYINFIQ